MGVDDEKTPELGPGQEQKQSERAEETEEPKDAQGGEEAAGATQQFAVNEPSMRRAPDPSSSKASQRLPHRGPPSKVPEVHVLGEVVGGTDFGTGVSCRWRLEHGKHWSILEGDPNGYSQVLCPARGGSARDACRF